MTKLVKCPCCNCIHHSFKKEEDVSYFCSCCSLNAKYMVPASEDDVDCCPICGSYNISTVNNNYSKVEIINVEMHDVAKKFKGIGFMLKNNNE